ncbi:hypothetical protein LTR08_003043 [Meristemomyces frigidus]|nr:hypothetical protein LTR08_003043 [Meristemomyces frigidus]
MDSARPPHRLLLALTLSLVPLALAQADLTSTATGMPTPTDSAPGSSSTSDTNNSMSSTSLVNYYFVFLAIILAVAALGIFLVYRKRKRARAYSRYSRENALTRDLNDWNAGGEAARGQPRGYWQGVWGRATEESAVQRREEGLNELGEAPPAYAPPKTREEVEREEAGLPAVPLQTLSREGVGLKPPDYAEGGVSEVTEHYTRPLENRVVYDPSGRSHASAGPSSS